MAGVFSNVDINDLVDATVFLHKIKPHMRDRVVVALEEPKRNDLNIVFHTVKEKDDPIEIVLVSAQFVIDYYAEENQKESIDVL